MGNKNDTFKKILVVEDDEGSRALLVKVLGTSGYDVIDASNGADAIKAYEQSKPDVVLLDIRLPDFDGFELIGKFKQLKLEKDIPVIACTAYSDICDEKFKQSGFCGHLYKPFKVSRLARDIQGILNSRASNHGSL